MIKLPFAKYRQFFIGVAATIVVLLIARYVINDAEFPDSLVGPLLMRDSATPGDAIVVLGGGVVGDCVPNLNSMRRIVLGSRLLKEGRAPLLVITGGLAGGKCPGAEAMKQLAVELGIPAERIILERKSTSTWENALWTTPLLRAEGVQRLVLVTDRLHMRRASAVFEHQGFTVEPVAVPVYEGHEDNVSMLFAGGREALAIAYYSMRGRMSDPASRSAQDTVTGQAGKVPKFTAASPEGPLVIFGASYAGNWPIDAIGSIPIVNMGVAGQRTFQFVERFERDVVERRPRAVLLWGFINNLFSSDNLNETADGIRADYSQMIARARAAGIEPILATEITARAHEGMTDRARSMVGRLLGKVSYHERINQSVTSINSWLAETGRKEGLLLLDFQAALADSSGRRRLEYADEDGSHVTPAGYQALTEFAQGVLARHFAVTPADETKIQP